MIQLPIFGTFNVPSIGTITLVVLRGRHHMAPGRIGSAPPCAKALSTGPLGGPASSSRSLSAADRKSLPSPPNTVAKRPSREIQFALRKSIDNILLIYY